MYAFDVFVCMIVCLQYLYMCLCMCVCVCGTRVKKLFFASLHRELQEILARMGHQATREFPESKEKGERPVPRAPRGLLDPQALPDPKVLQVHQGSMVLTAKMELTETRESVERL